ncbi:alpha/beta hydrolase [Pedobacter sp. PWIIR3]
MLKYKINHLLVLIMICASTMVQAQQVYKNVSLTPVAPVVDQRFEFIYDAVGTPLENRDSVQAIVYYFNDYAWKGADVKLSQAGKNKWTGNYQVPANSSFFTMKFLAGDKFDNNQDKSYGFLLQDVNGRNLPSGYAAWGLMRSPAYGYTIPNYLNGHSINDTVTFMWLQKDLQYYNNPKSQSVFAVPYAKSLMAAYGEQRRPEVRKVVAHLGKDGGTKEDLLKASYLLSSVLNEQGKADSLNQVITKRFGGTEFAKLAAYQAIKKEQDAAKQTTLSEAFLAKYPAKEANTWFDETYKIEYDQVYLIAVLNKIKKNNFKVVDTYVDQLPYGATVAILNKVKEFSHSAKNPYSEKLLKHMETFRNNPPDQYSSLAPSEWKKQFEASYLLAGNKVFGQERVTFKNTDTITFGGTISFPEAHWNGTAVVLMSGTGKQDRDAMMAGHPWFKTIAEYLNSQGLVVLRMDDRGTGETNGTYEDATTADFAKDALAAVAYLKTRKDLKIRKIGLLGHSEGGASISIAAAQSDDVAFLISLSGLALTGLESQILQNQDIVAAAPIPDYDKKRFNEINELMFETAFHYADSVNLHAKLNEEYNAWKVKDEAYFKTLNVEFDHFRFPIYSWSLSATRPWYRFFIKYNPADYLTKVKVPILAINGGKISW